MSHQKLVKAKVLDTKMGVVPHNCVKLKPRKLVLDLPRVDAMQDLQQTSQSKTAKSKRRQRRRKKKKELKKGA